MTRRFGIWVLGFGILVAAGAGCAKARAASVPDGPPLSMPAPPERILVPVEPPVPAAAQPEPEPEPAPPTAAVPRTPPKPVAAPKPQPAPQPAAQAPPVDTRELTTAATSEATERNVRDTLARAARDLGRVNYKTLSADGRAQYDLSKRFSAQAQSALRERNFVFAATLADKAATLAAELLQ